MANIYEIITEKILNRIEQAEKEKVHFYWIKPWTGGCKWSESFGTRKPYAGINQMILDNGEYLTYNMICDYKKTLPEEQAEKVKIKKGSHKQPVFYYGCKDKTDADGNVVKKTLPDGTEETEKTFFVRYFSAYHIEDIEGVESRYPAQHFDHTPDENAKRLDEYIRAYVRAEGITMEYVKNGSRCFYRPSDHFVRVPEAEGFKSLYQFYSSSMHELIHSSSKGLKRELGKGFGTTQYCKEELVAQVGASMALNIFGIVPDNLDDFDNDIAYIKNWSDYLKNNKREILIASSQAEKAVKYFIEVAERQLIKEKFEGLTDVALQYRDGFLFVQEGSDGTYFDYTIFNNDRVLVDGGQIESDQVAGNLGLAVKKILDSKDVDITSTAVLTEANKEELLCYERGVVGREDIAR